MNVHTVSAACRMHWAYIVLTLLVTCALGELDDNRCNVGTFLLQ